MKIRNKKKVEEVKDEEIIVADEVVVEPVDEIPEDAEVVDEVVIEPVEEEEEEVKDEEVVEDEEKEDCGFRVGDRVALISAIDYFGRPISVDIFDLYTFYAIEDDKVQLRKQNGLILFTKLSNIRKIN